MQTLFAISAVFYNLLKPVVRFTLVVKMILKSTLHMFIASDFERSAVQLCKLCFILFCTVRSVTD